MRKAEASYSIQEKQERQCTYDMTLRGVHAIIVGVEMLNYNTT